MEDDQQNISEEISQETSAPKKRGRKPKAESGASGESAPKKRPGRPKNNKNEGGETGETAANADDGQKNPAQTEGGDLIDKAKAVKRKYGRNVRRDDGPSWRDYEPAAQTESEDSETETVDADFFEHRNRTDEFAYHGNSSENGRGEDATEDDGAEIPVAFSTSEEDLVHDNYGERNDSEDDGNEDNESTAERRAETESAPDYSENGYDNRSRYNNKWQNRNQNSQNRNQQNNRNPNQQRNNQNNQRNQNNQQRSQQNNRNPNQQRNNPQNQNRNQQNSQRNQNNPQRNNPQNQNRNNPQQNKQRKPKWMQNQNAETDAMNPGELPEWDALKTQAALNEFLGKVFFGKEEAKEAETAEGKEPEVIAVPFNDSAEAAAETEMPVEVFEEKTAEAESPATDEAKEAKERDPQDELDELMRSKKADDMSYWELMNTATDSNIIERGKREEPKHEEKAETETPTKDAVAETPEDEKNAFDAPTTLTLPELGVIESIDGFDEIYPLHIRQIQERFDGLGVPYRRGAGKADLMADFFKFAAQSKKLVKVSGTLDVFEGGFGGALTFAADNYRLGRMSAYVPQMFIDRYALKRGHTLSVLAMPPREGSKETCPIAVQVSSAMGEDPDQIKNIIPFTDLTPYYPTERIIMEADANSGWDNLSMRTVDLLTPVGFGQRALIVAPPRTGKTVLMQGMAKSIRRNAPKAKLMILLVDERPEEVTDFRRSVDAEVIASTFDEDAQNHVHAAEMVISRARRLVETGENVIILLDSITRLARAYNALMPNGGRTMSGGVEANALQKPKQFFGSARNIEGGGSLTIIGTALVETGSKMDEVIFEEFKGTGNLELHLDRALSDKRIFPSINMEKSGTRKEELLYHPEELTKIYALRRAMKGVPATDAMEMLVQRLKKVKTNVEFLLGLNR